MLNVYLHLCDCLVNNERGTVSFEYILVSACIIGAVAAVFGVGGSALPIIEAALTTGLTAVTTAFTTAIAG